MKYLFRLLAFSAILFSAISCSKGAAFDPESGDAYTLIITGTVIDQESAPLEGITVTLESVLPAEGETPLTETARTDAEGAYRIQKRFNAPAYQFNHVLHFMDENHLYNPYDMVLTVHQKSLSRTEHGYYLYGINASLSKK